MKRRDRLLREFIQFYYLSVMILFAYTLASPSDTSSAFSLGVIFFTMIIASLVIPFFLYRKPKGINMTILFFKFMVVLIFWQSVEVIAHTWIFKNTSLLDGTRSIWEQVFMVTQTKGHISYPLLSFWIFAPTIDNTLPPTVVLGASLNAWFSLFTSIAIVYVYLAYHRKYKRIHYILLSFLSGVLLIWLIPSNVPWRLGYIFPFHDFDKIIAIICFLFLPLSIVLSGLWGKWLKLDGKK